MNTVLLSAGAACVIIAVVGGGASAFGVEVPLIEDRRRQVLLFVVGLAFLGAAIALDNGDGGSKGDSPEVKTYRQEVRATCTVLSRQQFPPQNSDFSYDRDAVMQWFNNTLVPSWQSVTNELWKRPVPDGFEDEVGDARQSATSYFKRVREVGNRLGTNLPARFDRLSLQRFFEDLGAGIADSGGNLESAMRVLADERCIRPS
jgi:hypothetical protein